MRQSICRALLVLELLVPLSRSSFGDTFLVSGSASGSGDLEDSGIMSPSLSGGGGAGFSFSVGGDFTDGDYTVATFRDGGIDPWTFNGVAYDDGQLEIDVVSVPFLVEASGVTGVPITWTGELFLYSSDGTVLYDIDMAGVGTANFFPVLGTLNDSWVWVGADASLIGVAYVTSEPSTLTLMGIAGIAPILGIRFRRRYGNAN